MKAILFILIIFINIFENEAVGGDGKRKDKKPINYLGTGSNTVGEENTEMDPSALRPAPVADAHFDGGFGHNQGGIKIGGESSQQAHPSKKNKSSADEPKITFIDSPKYFYFPDPVNFKHVVQQLTGKDAPPIDDNQQIVHHQNQNPAQMHKLESQNANALYHYHQQQKQLVQKHLALAPHSPAADGILHQGLTELLRKTEKRLDELNMEHRNLELQINSFINYSRRNDLNEQWMKGLDETISDLKSDKAKLEKEIENVKNEKQRIEWQIQANINAAHK